MSKDRLDTVLVDRGYFQSRERAKAAIMAGVVFINGQRVEKAGTAVSDDCEIFIKEDICPYVGRGGLKLEKALKEFNIDLNEKVCVDIGASTGGFTDCMLQNGAKKVYAIDVGYGQLDYKLRKDPRVVNLERVNIRYLEEGSVEPEVDFISIDVSFISLALVLPIASGLMKSEGELICLVKPQFEAGREQVGKGGIVRDKKVHEEVLEKIIKCGLAEGLNPAGLTYSPLKGAKGNIEYLLYFKKSSQSHYEPGITEVVCSAHHELNNESGGRIK